jgi:hypothetical protein
MPIIPRQENITSSVPVATLPVPGIETFTGTGPIVASGLGKIGQSVEDAALRNLHTRAILEADNARTKLAMDFDTLKDRVLSAPAKLKENVGTPQPGEDEEAAAYDPGILRFQSKAETMMADWVPAAQKMRDDSMKSVGPLAQRYLQRHANTLYATATIQMQGQQRIEVQHELLALAQDSLHDVHRNIENMPPIGPTTDPSGAFVFDPNAPTVARYRQIINQKIDLLAARGLDAKLVYSMRAKELARFDKDWSQKEMDNDPAAWNSSVVTKTNGWHSQLDEGAWEKLRDRSTALLAKDVAEADKKWKELEGNTYAEASQLLRKGLLTDDWLDQAVGNQQKGVRLPGVGTRTLTGEHALELGTRLQNWKDQGSTFGDQDTTRRMRARASSINATQADYDEVGRLAATKKIIEKEAEAMQNNITATLKFQKTDNFRTFKDEYSEAVNLMHDSLPMNGLLGPLDTVNQGLRAQLRDRMITATRPSPENPNPKETPLPFIQRELETYRKLSSTQLNQAEEKLIGASRYKTPEALAEATRTLTREQISRDPYLLNDLKLWKQIDEIRISRPGMQATIDTIKANRATGK